MKSPNNHTRKKQRKIEYLESISNKHYIFCEGEKTEPIYFKGFEAAIRSNPIYKNSVHIEVLGIGAETLRVLFAAEDYVNTHQIHDASIWCVYDKDSFPSKDFNAVSEKVNTLNSTQKTVKYFVAWSNQCIEYWFILHFDWYTADNDRAYYRKYLHKIFAELGWIRYEKRNSELFEILTLNGDPKMAIKYAKKRLEECKGRTDALSAPATRVHLLVEELAKYLPEDLKKRYL